MKKIFLAFLFSFIGMFMYSQTPNFSWAVGSGRTSNEAGVANCKDIYGNVYVTGTFASDTVYFGALRCIRPAGVTSVVYTVKYDTLGNAIWVNTGYNTNTNTVYDVTTDSLGNIYVTGTYMNASMIFGATTLVNAGGTNFSNDIFLVKYDNSGTMLWARRYGGVNKDEAKDIEIDISGNILMTGVFASPTFVLGSTTLANSTGSSPADDTFVTKLDAAGNPLWAKMGNDLNSGYSCSNAAVGVSSDPLGNVYITGYYECNTTFSPIALTGIPTTTSGDNIYVVKYNSSGTVQWAKSFSATDNFYPSSISVDQYGYSYVSGTYYNGPVTFGTTTLASSGGDDCFFLRLKPDGTVSWAKKIGTTNYEQINKLRADKYGFVTLIGSYRSTITIGTTSLTLTAGSSINTCDVFVARYDSTGTALWAKKAGGIKDDIASSVCIANDAVYITGRYASPSFVFSPPTLTNYVSTGASTDMFLTKICTTPFQPSTMTGPTTVCSGISATYTVPPVVNATSYAWTLPSGWTGSSTTNSITVITGGSSGTMSVTAYSGCCSSMARTLAVTVTPLPAMPGVITGTTTLCAGVTQTYSIGAVSGATSYTWTLPSGWSGSSTTNSISVTTGTNSGNIQVNANNTCGAGPAQSAAITISLSGSTAFPFAEGFQTLPFVPTGWSLYNPNADLTWVRSTTTGGFGTSSACTFFNNYSGALSGGRDAVRTPRFDFSSCISASLKFDLAYARRNGTNIDSLNVYASSNCGITWTRIYGKGSTSLATAPDYAAALFVPTAAQWRTDSIDLSSYLGQPNVMFSLENKSGLGQGLYLDNVNITVVNSSANVSIAQTSGGTPLCTGSMAGFTATPTAGGATPSYQWKINGVNVGTNSPTFYNSSLNNGDTVVCVMTSSIVGVLNNPATSNQIVVSVSPLIAPSVTISASSSSVCTGGSLTLSGVGASTYSWSSGITNGISFVPSATASYTLTGTDAMGCQNTVIQTIPVNPLPTITSTASSSIVCAGSPVTLNGAGAHVYSWTGGVVNGVVFNPTLTTTYTVTGTDTLTGCQNTSTRTIIVNAIPVVTATASDTVLCEGEDVILSGGGTANTYTWSGGVNNSSPYFPAATATYTVTGTITSSGCSNTTSIAVVVNPLPNITTVSSAASVCFGTNVTFTASGTHLYNWSGGITNAIPFVPLATGTYIVTGTDTLTGCQDTASRTIIVYALPNVNANSTAGEICTGGSVTLTATGAVSYAWDGGVTNGVAFTPLATQVYTVIGTDVHGCADTVLKTVVVNAFPVTACIPTYFPSYISPLNYFKVDTVSGPGGNYWTSSGPLPGNQTCSNQLHLIEGQTYYFSINLSGSLWGKAGFWIDYNNDGNMAPTDYVNRVGASYPIYSAWSTGYWPITVTVPGGAVLNAPLRLRLITYDESYDGPIVDGCHSGIHGRYYDYTVYISPALPPVANFSASDTSVCVGDTLNFSNASSNATSYAWDFGDGTLSSSISPSHVYAAPGTYSVQLIASNSTGSDTLIRSNHIVVNSVPVITATATATSICIGNSIALSGSGGLAYSWDNSVTDGQTFVPASSTIYHVSGTDVNGCIGYDSISISVNQLPAIPMISQTGPDLSSSASVIYEWFLNGSSTGDTLQTFTPLQNGYYSVTVTDANGCSSASSAFLFDFVWPGDANNDSTVNNYDLLPIGVFYSQTGSSRSTVSNSWQAYPSLDWGIQQTNTQDIKHVDCNGDGTIDNNDTLAVNLNYSSIHAMAPWHGAGVRLTDPDLYLTSGSGTYLPGDWVVIDVMLGTASLPVNNLYGIAFDINYDVSFVQSGTESLNYPNSWLAQPGVDGITIAKINSGIGAAFGAETRIDHLNTDGYGRIATFKFKIDSAVSSVSTMNLSFSGYQAIDSVGNLVNFNTNGYSILIDPTSTSIAASTESNDITIYPNPYAESTTIGYTLSSKSEVNIDVYNAVGQKVQNIANGEQQAGEHKFNFSAKKSGMDAGVYFVKIMINGNVEMRRIVEMK